METEVEVQEDQALVMFSCRKHLIFNYLLEITQKPDFGLRVADEVGPFSSQIPFHFSLSPLYFEWQSKQTEGNKSRPTKLAN